MNRILALLFCVVFPLASSAQDRGIIQCSGQQQSVPAWTDSRPSGFVVENLGCGQMVSITGLERGYVRIQIGEKLGYVDARFVRVQDSTDQTRRIAELEAEVKALKQSPAAETAAAPVPSPPASSQHSYEPQNDTPRAEFFGGYTYVHLDNSAGWMDGWNAAVTGNLTSFFGLKAEGSGLYAKNSLFNDLRYSAYSFMGGPQLTAHGRSVDVFGHALFGVTHLGASAPFGDMRVGASVNAFSMAFGGGVDWHREKWGIRILQADYFPMRALGSIDHDIRISSGLLLRFQ
jgi:hypothetical protein